MTDKASKTTYLSTKASEHDKEIQKSSKNVENTNTTTTITNIGFGTLTKVHPLVPKTYPKTGPEKRISNNGTFLGNGRKTLVWTKRGIKALGQENLAKNLGNQISGPRAFIGRENKNGSHGNI